MSLKSGGASAPPVCPPLAYTLVMGLVMTHVSCEYGTLECEYSYLSNKYTKLA